VPEAFEALANGDPRPLLVLRDCEACAGGEDAFLSREFDNEKTILLGRWFHAVKLPMEVLDDTHSFHELFSEKKPAHLFLATADGKTRVDLDGKQSQKKLWAAMTKVLKKSYKKSPDSALKEMRKLLDALDRYDNLVAAAEQRLMDETASKGTDAASVKKLAAELEELNAERKAVLEEGAEVDDLQLRG
jgi:hypothetical protein